MAEYNFAAQANTIQIEDITSDEHNQIILQRIKDNDTSVNELYIYSVSCPDTDVGHCNSDNYYYFPDFVPGHVEELGWLGYYIGQNTTIQTLHFFEMNCNMYDSERSFFEGLSCNKTIQCIDVDNFDLSEGSLFSMMVPFFKSNDSLSKVEIGYCEFGVEEARQLSLAIGNCGKSLKTFSMDSNEMENGQLVDIITALSMHPQLERLNFTGNMGRNECTALSTLLRCTTTNLQMLDLRGRNRDISIDDDRLEILVQALREHTLQELNLGSNESITIRGWTALSTLLKMPGSNLEELDISNNNIGDEGALVFANALANNSSLETLNLTGCNLSRKGWVLISNLICDTSSINNTYMSNHTLQSIKGIPNTGARTVRHYLILNTNSEDKEQTGMQKILFCHHHINMQPFFEWELKVLPLMIKWFTKAAARVTTYDQKISRLRLSSTFDFIREFPMLYIEPVTRKEIAEYTAMEEQLQGKPLWQEKLGEIRECKARSMRRLL